MCISPRIPSGRREQVCALLRQVLAAFGTQDPGAGEGLRWQRAGREPWEGALAEKSDAVRNSLLHGRGCHAGYEALPAQKLPFMAKGKGMVEVESPARDGSRNRVFCHHLVGGVQSPLEFL